MKELDLLKKDWNATNKQFKTISANEIGSMLHKKSSSIIKKIFYISISELLFWLAVSVLPPLFSASIKDKMDTVEDGNTLFFKGLTFFSFTVIFVFVYLLFKAYKTISNTDSVKILMENIIKTRKVIQYYVIYNLAGIFISTLLGLYYSFQEDPVLFEKMNHLSSSQLFVVLGIIALVIFGFLLLIWFFYKVLYGFLIHKLTQNYKELKKLEL